MQELLASVVVTTVLSVGTICMHHMLNASSKMLACQLHLVPIKMNVWELTFSLFPKTWHHDALSNKKDTQDHKALGMVAAIDDCIT